ncbi:MAG: hypothetical protein OXF79_16970 [Chloroflexi bacterium]|nr:hypothetical protein [Chloroflexota bacterium]
MTTTAVDANMPEQLRASEFQAATERAAVYPDDAGILLLTGEDARDLLNRLSTNEIDPDAPAGEVAVTVLTSDRGRIVDLVYVIHCGDHQVMLTSPGQQQNVIDFLDKYTIMEDLEVEDITEQTSLLTVTGPEATEILRAVLDGGNFSMDPRPGAILDTEPAGAAHDVFVGDPMEGERSFRAWLVIPPVDAENSEHPPTYHLIYPDTLIEREVSPYATEERGIAHLEAAGAASISAATAEALRIAQARPAYGSEMSDTYNPLEAGLIGAIDFHKGCYIGQEVIARLDTYHKVQKYLVSLSFDAGPAQAGALPGSRLVNDDGAAMGVVTSATVVPSADGARIIGLGYVRTAAVEIGGTLRVVAEEENGDGDTCITACITAQPLLFGPEKPGTGQ